MKIDKNRISKIIGRVELDYRHRMSPRDFCMIYDCEYFHVGIDEKISYVPEKSISAIKEFFPENTIQTLESGAMCEIKKHKNGWLVKFNSLNPVIELDKTEQLRMRYRNGNN